MENASYPSLQIYWKEDADQCGWTGKAEIWTDGKTLQPCGNHTVTLRQGTPLGSISISVDEFSHGAWSYGSLEGAGITERDLQWAGLYAVESIKRKELLEKSF
jgi:hypothetical protein